MDSGEVIKEKQSKTDQSQQMRATSTTKSKTNASNKPTVAKEKVGIPIYYGCKNLQVKVCGGGTEVEPKYFVRGEPSLASIERLRVEVDLPGVKSGKEVMLMKTFIEYME